MAWNRWGIRCLWVAAYTLAANSALWILESPAWLWFTLPVFLACNACCGSFDRRLHGWTLRVCRHGAESLLVFSAATTASVVWQTVLFISGAYTLKTGLFGILMCVVLLAFLFWNGMISVYLTSVQLGIRRRVIGAVCGMIPIVHLFALAGIIKTVVDEVHTESAKQALNASRKEAQICKTRYPVLMVHGVFFRDFKRVNYWGRIPEQLTQNGATVFYGEHQSAAAIADCAREIASRVQEIVESTGCGKVNIIAHSKGGLDCRYAMAHLGMAPYVASITTVNSPHRGCAFAEYLLHIIPTAVKNKVAAAYNAAAKKLGDESPDFLAAVTDLTASSCKEMFGDMPDPEGVVCLSVGSVLKKARHGRFPLNMSYDFVKRFDGINDGLVGEESFAWGERYELIEPQGKRGISHGDMIDLNRENFDGFDVREWYVRWVAALKERGL